MAGHAYILTRYRLMYKSEYNNRAYIPLNLTGNFKQFPAARRKSRIKSRPGHFVNFLKIPQNYRNGLWLSSV